MLVFFFFFFKIDSVCDLMWWENICLIGAEIPGIFVALTVMYISIILILIKLTICQSITKFGLKATNNNKK